MKDLSQVICEELLNTAGSIRDVSICTRSTDQYD